MPIGFKIVFVQFNHIFKKVEILRLYGHFIYSHLCIPYEGFFAHNVWAPTHHICYGEMGMSLCDAIGSQACQFWGACRTSSPTWTKFWWMKDAWQASAPFLIGGGFINWGEEAQVHWLGQSFHWGHSKVQWEEGELIIREGQESLGYRAFWSGGSGDTQRWAIFCI